MRRAAGYSEESIGGPTPNVFPLPNLPGYNVDAPLAGIHKKGQTLRYKNGYAFVEDEAPMRDNRYTLVPRSLLESTKFPDDNPTQDQSSAGSGKEWGNDWGPKTICGLSKAPHWLIYDRQVLRFFCYFEEHVPNNLLEKSRIRRCELRFFLEDDTVEMVEPVQENSGLAQGKHLRRHRPTFEDGHDLAWRSLAVGGTVELYRSKYHLVGCDSFTREFFRRQAGVSLQEDMPCPDGPYDLKAAQKQQQEHRRAASADRAALRSSSGGKLKDPLALQHAVLRLLCVWDSSAEIGLEGDKVELVLTYHLYDDTVDVREARPRAGDTPHALESSRGRDPFPMLLRRMKLPKIVPPVFGRPMSPRSRAVLQGGETQFYHWRDLRIGSTINCFNRQLLVTDMDGSTRRWYSEQLGLSDEQLRPIEVDFFAGPRRPPTQIPPHGPSNFGSAEDSLRNVLQLIPRVPTLKGRYEDYLENVDKVLRFSARIVPMEGRPQPGPFDARRKFVLTYHLLDGTVSIWEPREANSGMPGGTFLERIRVPAARGDGNISEADLVLGEVVEIFGRGFRLVSADGATLTYMEQQGGERFPWSDFERVRAFLAAELSHLPPAAVREALFRAEESSESGFISFEKLYDTFVQDLHVHVALHACVTLVRRLGDAERGGLLVGHLLAALGTLHEDDRGSPPGRGYQSGAEASAYAVGAAGVDLTGPRLTADVSAAAQDSMAADRRELLQRLKERRERDDEKQQPRHVAWSSDAVDYTEPGPDGGCGGGAVGKADANAYLPARALEAERAAWATEGFAREALRGGAGDPFRSEGMEMIAAAYMRPVLDPKTVRGRLMTPEIHEFEKGVYPPQQQQTMPAAAATDASSLPQSLVLPHTTPSSQSSAQLMDPSQRPPAGLSTAQQPPPPQLQSSLSVLTGEDLGRSRRRLSMSATDSTGVAAAMKWTNSYVNTTSTAAAANASVNAAGVSSGSSQVPAGAKSQPQRLTLSSSWSDCSVFSPTASAVSPSPAASSANSSLFNSFSSSWSKLPPPHQSLPSPSFSEMKGSQAFSEANAFVSPSGVSRDADSYYATMQLPSKQQQLLATASAGKFPPPATADQGPSVKDPRFLAPPGGIGYRPPSAARDSNALDSNNTTTTTGGAPGFSNHLTNTTHDGRALMASVQQQQQWASLSSLAAQAGLPRPLTAMSTSSAASSTVSSRAPYFTSSYLASLKASRNTPAAGISSETSASYNIVSATPIGGTEHHLSSAAAKESAQRQMSSRVPIPMNIGVSTSMWKTSSQRDFGRKL